jgi:membrane-associated phospholipid phosphatase
MEQARDPARPGQPSTPWATMPGILAVVCASAGITTVCYAFSDVRFVNAGPFFLPYGATIAAIVVLSFYIRLRAPEAGNLIVLLFMVFAFFVTATNLLALQYCLATTRAIEFTDAIRAADHALGFDWMAFSAKVSRIPYAAGVIGFCYQQWIAEFVVVVVLLAALGKTDDCYRLTFAFAVSGMAMVSISGFLDVKSVDAVAAYATNAVHLPTGVNPYYLKLLTALRSDGPHVVDLNHLGGLVSFPSCHAGTAVLLATATRNLKRLWIPFLCFNELILVGTITEGGHYLSDVLAGCAFAVAAVALYGWLTRARPAAAPWFARVAPAFAGVVGLNADGRDGVGGDRRRSASLS